MLETGRAVTGRAASEWLARTALAVGFVLAAASPELAEAQQRRSAQGTAENTSSRTLLAQAEGSADRGDEESGEQLQRSDSMEFDARLIRGERSSGAVFLFKRTPRKLPSMVERRRTYLEGSVRRTLGNDWAESFESLRERSRADESGEGSSEERAKGDIIDRLDEQTDSAD